MKYLVSKYLFQYLARYVSYHISSLCEYKM